MDEHSKTAILAAVARGMHARLSTDPLLDDPFAESLYSNAEAERITEVALQTGLSEAQREALGEDRTAEDIWRAAFEHGALAASSIARNRYAEDCLRTAVRDEGVDQYVIVGAGLDTFAFREPALAQDLDVYELDHPATQAFKRQRFQEAGLTPPDSVHFIPVDLTEEHVKDALADSGFSSERPAFISWLGVTLYLPTGAIADTLDAIADVSAPGSSIVFDCIDSTGADPERTTPRLRRFMEMVESMGEPTTDGIDVDGLDVWLEKRGYELREHLEPADQEARYFSSQPPTFGPTEHYHFIHATVR